MDSMTLAAVVIIAIAILILVWMLKGKDRFRIGAKTPGGWQADVEAGNHPPPPGAGIKASDVTARTGDVKVTNHDSNGIEVERVDAGGNVELTSGTPGNTPDPKA